MADDSTPSPVRAYLVDDHELVRRGLRDLLGTAGDIEVVGEAASVGEALVDPPDDLDVARVEHGRVLDADARERRHGEEATVVELRVAATPEQQLVVLRREDVAHVARAGAVREGELVVEVPDDAPFGVDRDLARFESGIELRPEHGQPQPSAEQAKAFAEIAQQQIFTEGSTNAFLVGSILMLAASVVIWIFLDVKHEELATDGPEGVVAH